MRNLTKAETSQPKVSAAIIVVLLGLTAAITAIAVVLTLLLTSAVGVTFCGVLHVFFMFVELIAKGLEQGRYLPGLLFLPSMVPSAYIRLFYPRDMAILKVSLGCGKAR